MPDTSRAIVLTPLTQSDAEIDNLVGKLQAYADAFELSLSDDQAQQCIKHLLYVCQVNEYMNLTRITNIDEAIVLHILDSLLLAKAVDAAPDKFLDFGTGAGFPGIPFGIYLGSPGILLDSVGKKISAVNVFCNELGLSYLSGVHDRVEAYAKQHKHEFDCVLARAVAALPVLLEYATPLLQQGGHVVFAKANPEASELEAGDRVAKICGLKLIRSLEFDLSCDLGHRTILVYEKYKPASIKLPRAVGMARKNPLG